MGLLNDLQEYIKANTPRSTRPPVSPATVFNQGLLNPNQFNAPQANRFKDSLFGMAGVVPGVGDVASGMQAADFWNRGEKLNAGLSALGALPLIPALGAHTVYHGSPHKFDKFDMSKIGTGEGAQAYGHGLYFAESPGVAQSYAKNLARPVAEFPTGMKVDMQQPISRGQWRTATQSDDPVMEQALRALEYNKGNAGSAAKALDSFDDAEAIDLLNHWAANPSSMPNIDPGSNLYKVDIPDESIPRMLDWDKPLSEQAPEVHSALKNLAARDAQKYGEGGGVDYYMGDPDSYAGGDLIRYMREQQNHEEIASYLNSQGIPGIRYLDQTSRDAGEGTSNFVLFDDQLPRILEVNGQPTGLLSYADEAKKIKKK
jgi:hypothetical protein